MDFTLSKQQAMVQKMYKEFAENEVKPLAQKVDAEEYFPKETVEKMAKLGMMGIYFPKEVGGAGGDVLSYVMAVEEMSKVCGTTGVILSAHTSLCAAPIYENGTADQKAKYLPKLCSHIHFPMQSGSDRILQLMRRPYKHEKYERLCAAMREARPDLAITTDIIVGFPGETDEDFRLTVEAVERIQFDNAFVFQYSPRRDTPAAVMDAQICLRVKEERNHALLEVVNRIATARNHALVGTVQSILVEGPSKNNPLRLQGRTSQNKPVMIPAGSASIGSIVPVHITECTGFTLYGDVQA